MSHWEDINTDTRAEIFREFYGREGDPEVRKRNEQARGYMNRSNKVTYYKSVDSVVNKEIERITRELVTYVECTHKFKIRKIVCKFIRDKEFKYYLAGLEDLYFDLFKSGPYDYNTVAQSLGGYEVNIEDLLQRLQEAEPIYKRSSQM